MVCVIRVYLSASRFPIPLSARRPPFLGLLHPHPCKIPADVLKLVYGILGIPAKLVFLVLKHALKFLGIWNVISKSAGAMVSKAKSMAKKFGSSLPEFMGGEPKKVVSSDDDALESFDSTEKEIMEREKANENPLVADDESKKDQSMCLSCPMSIKFALSLGLMDLFVGFGISGFKVGLGLSLGNIPTMVGCAVGCMKVVFNAFSLFKEVSAATKRQDAYFGTCNPHSMGMCMMLGRVQQCGSKWGKLPDVVRYSSGGANLGAIVHPLKHIATRKPRDTSGYFGAAKKWASKKKEESGWMELASSTKHKNSRLHLGHSAHKLSQRLKKGTKEDEEKEEKKMREKEAEERSAKAVKELNEELTLKEVEDLGDDENGGQLCTIFNSMSPFVVRKNTNKKDNQANPLVCAYRWEGGQLTGDSKCIPQTEKLGTCARMDLADGCRRTLKVMATNTKKSKKDKCSITDMNPDSSSLFRRCRDILGCLTPFSPRGGENPPFTLTPEKISATILDFMKQVDDNEISADRKLSPKEATDELIKTLSAYFQQQSASSSQFYANSAQCVFEWNVKPKYIFRTGLWVDQCQTDNWSTTNGEIMKSGKLINGETMKNLHSAVGWADEWFRQQKGSETKTYNKGVMLADMLGASTGFSKNTCACVCCRNTESDDHTKKQNCQPVLAGAIRMPSKGHVHGEDCNAKACSDSFPSQCPDDPRTYLLCEIRTGCYLSFGKFLRIT